jgi:hypothetical protein
VPWQHAPVEIKVEQGAVSQLIVAKVAGHQGVLEVDSDINVNPPFPPFLTGTVWYKAEMFKLGANSWHLTVKKPGGYYLTFAPQISIAPNILGYAHLSTPNPIVPSPGDWYGNIDWVLDGQPL